jgi:hypothetical protein
VSREIDDEGNPTDEEQKPTKNYQNENPLYNTNL